MKIKYDFSKKIYLITDEKLLSRRHFIDSIRQACAGGIDIIQIREKKSALADRTELCRKAVKAAHEMGAKVIINDDPELAAASEADGVHIGKKDAGLKKARALLGPDAIIGVSCYGDINLAMEMEKGGADYVSFGNFYLSPTKPEEKIIPLSILTEAKKKINIPVLAIGGINENNFTEVLESGADSICCVSALIKKGKIKRWRIK